MSGPTIAPTLKQPAQMPMAVARRRGSRNRFAMSARVDGVSVAPARPSSARAAISMAGLVAYAVSTDAAPNAAAPPRSSFRRPIRSPTAPMVIRNAPTMNP